MKVKAAFRILSDRAFCARVAAMLLGTLVLVPCARPQVPPSEAIRQAGQLSLHEPVERELGPGQTDVFTVDLAAGQFLHVVIEPKGLDVGLAIEDPEGKTLITIDRVTRVEPAASLVADRSGWYRVKVGKSSRTAETGRYRIEMTDLRPPTDEDRARIQAEKEFSTARQEARAPNKESRLKAIDRFQEAASLWHSLKDGYWEAFSLDRIGASYTDLGEYQKALDHFNRSLALRRGVGDHRGEAVTLQNIAVVYADLGEPRKALEYYDQALALLRELGDRANEANTLTNIASAYTELDENERALDYNNRALTLLRAMGNGRGEAHVLFSMGNTYRLGERRKALDYYNQALILIRASKDRKFEAGALNNIGTVYQDLGENQKALDYYNQALAIESAMGDRLAQADALNNIAYIYEQFGENQKALDHYNQALLLKRAIRDRRGEAEVLGNLGGLYRALGENQKALDYSNQALPLWRAVGGRANEAIVLHSIGGVYSNLGENQKALGYYSQALQLSRAVSDRMNEGKTLTEIGTLYLHQGKPQEAMDYYNQALQVNRAGGDRDGEGSTLMHMGRAHAELADSRRALENLDQALSLVTAVGDRKLEGITLYEMARVERDRGNLAQARTLAARARDIVESLRTKVIGEDLRTSYFASVQDYYELEMDVLMRLHRTDSSRNYQADALLASERARARTLLETLSEAGADIREGVDPVVLERERTLQAQLHASELARMRTLCPKHTAQQAIEVENTVRDLIAQYAEVRTQILAQSPRYGALRFPQPLKLEEIQKEVLDADTLLLEYALGDQQSFLWVVSPTEIASVVLPKRSEVERLSRSFYDDLTKPETSGVPEAGKVLTRILLGNVASSLGNKRLLIVANGALQYMPFAALPDPDGFQQPLMVNHEIVSVPSASTLAVLRRETLKRKPAQKTLAILADPVFSPDDTRIGGGPERIAVAVRDADAVLARSLTDLGFVGQRLPRLPGTRREAAGIIPLVPAVKRKQALDFDASRATLMSPEIGQYRILHLATHGLLNSAHPELSGIVLSLVDRQGRPQDGFLRLNDVYNLKLSADLVVLSACQTGLGKDVRGEGLVGLTRGFMYAGARRVVASLWKVDDRATAELMKQFYTAMLRGQGRRPGEALREAQIAMWKTKGWENPYYWAAFTLQGEWR